MSIGQRIREARRRHGFTQPELARRCGWESQSRVSMYERDRREPSFADLKRLAQALGESLGYFVEAPVERPTKPAQNANITPLGEPLNRAWLLEAMQNVSAIAAERGVTLSPRQYHTAVLWWYDDMVDERRDKPPRRDVKTILKLVGAE